MDDLTASILTLLIVSPSLFVLFVLIARRVRGIWKVCLFSTQANLKEAMECRIRFQGKLCGEQS
jgi:hypothetical protein